MSGARQCRVASNQRWQACDSLLGSDAGIQLPHVHFVCRDLGRACQFPTECSTPKCLDPALDSQRNLL
eukprot:10904042-Alexandrium_andersonii.AAC.1